MSFIEALCVALTAAVILDVGGYFALQSTKAMFSGQQGDEGYLDTVFPRWGLVGFGALLIVIGHQRNLDLLTIAGLALALFGHLVLYVPEFRRLLGHQRR